MPISNYDPTPAQRLLMNQTMKAMSLFSFEALRFDTSDNICQSLRIMAEMARRGDLRKDGAELIQGEIRDSLTLTLSFQKVR